MDTEAYSDLLEEIDMYDSLSKENFLMSMIILELRKLNRNISDLDCTIGNLR